MESKHELSFYESDILYWRRVKNISEEKGKEKEATI